MLLLRTRTLASLAVASSAATVARAFCASASASAPASTSVDPHLNDGARTKADDWDASRYSTNAGFVPELGRHVLDMLAPLKGERILDVGCGDGVLTAEIKARGCTVVGIDFSPDMIAAAVKRDLEAYVMDASAINAPFLLNKLANHNREDSHDGNPPTQPAAAAAAQGPTVTEQDLPPAPSQPEGDNNRNGTPRAAEVDGAEVQAEEPPAFDAVFTNAALHWVRAPRTVIEGAKRVLRPGGRFVGEFGGHGNMAAVRVAMHAALWRRGVDPLVVDPWYFPTPREYRRLLESAGFIVDDVWLMPRPTILPAGTGMRGWLSTFTQAFLNAIPEDTDTSGGRPATDENGLTKTKRRIVDEALAALQPALRDKEGLWTADYVRLRFRAHLPEDSASGTAVDVERGGEAAPGAVGSAGGGAEA